MRKFRFKFEAVLKLRKSREEEALRLLGAAQRAYQAELATKSALLDELQESFKRRENLGTVPTKILDFELEQDFITGTKHRIVRQDQAIVRASRAVEKSLRAYLATRKETRMIEILREKDFAEFKKKFAVKEQKELDELSAMRFGQKTANPDHPDYNDEDAA